MSCKCGCDGKNNSISAPGIIEEKGTGAVIYETWKNPKVMFGVSVVSLLLTLIALNRS